MTELREKVERWCREESLEAAVNRDEESSFGCIVTLRELALSISLRSASEDENRLLLGHTFEFAVPDELPDGAERFVALCEGAALARSSLITCRPMWGQPSASAEVTVTLFAQDLTKQSFLTALEEMRKAGLVLERELQAVLLSAGVMAEVQAIIEESRAMASTVAAETANAEEPAPPAPEDVQPVVEEAPLVAEEPAPAVVEEAPAVVEEPAPIVAEEAPAMATEPPMVQEPAPLLAADRFCTSCGAVIRGTAKFCRTCGTPLEE